jgi:prevent-host-death family protein
MQTVGIKTLKNKLSEYLRAVARGETVVVTDRGKVVAEIIPPRISEGTTLAERKWAELIRRGLVTPAKRPPPALPPRRPAIMTLEDMLRDLDESRSDR